MNDIETGIEHVLEWSNLDAVATNGNVMLHSQSGSVKSGQMLAVMGPSGAGKSTFLDLLSKRTTPTQSDATITFDGSSKFNMRDLATYVEQDDALLGVLTVEETVTYAAKLSLPSSTPTSQITTLVQDTLKSLGLLHVASHRIGTPIQRGISGGQKRRVTIASAVVSRPRILLCDEPTSGLDSLTSWKVIQSIKTFAKATNTIVVATIHQPNWETFSLFDEVLFLSNGHCIYRGPVDDVDKYFETQGYPCPGHANPADHVIGIVNADFSSSAAENSGEKLNDESAKERMEKLAKAWSESPRRRSLTPTPHAESTHSKFEGKATLLNTPTLSHSSSSSLSTQSHRTLVLMQRMTLNYTRNILAYGVRLGMYAGMGFLLATIWVHMGKRKEAKGIDDRLSVHFFSVAFLGFMSVAGIPSFLEERAVFVRERNNGLYGPGAYTLANSLVSIPFLFVCATIFTVICYWAIGLHPGASEFFKFLAFLFIAIYIAEAQSILVAAILPIFVAALAIASFMNGLWMCVQGYFIRAINLPRFWYYTFHWIDYQTFAFELLAKNDLTGLTFSCETVAGQCQCSYPSSVMTAELCAVSGEDVLNALNINSFNVGLYAGIMLIIAVFYRVMFYAVLVVRKK